MMQASVPKTVLDSALDYFRKGWNVIPIKPKSKIAAVEWKPYQTEKVSEDQVRAWFENGEGYNVGIVTGAVSSIFVIDVDGLEARNYIMKVVERLSESVPNIFDSLVSKTGSGNGCHVILGFDSEEFPDGFSPQTLWKGSDAHSEIAVKSDGNYIVAPPSITENRYEFEADKKIIALSRKQIEMLFLAILEKPQPENTKIQDFVSKGINEPLAELATILAPYYGNGDRDYITFYLSGALRKSKFPYERAKQVIMLLAKDDEELEKRISVLDRTYAKTNVDEISGISGLRDTLSLKIEDAKAEEVVKRITNVLNSRATENALSDDEIINKTVEYLKSKYHFVTLEETREIYYYKDGVYVRGAETEIEKEAQGLFPDKMGNRKINEIKGVIRRETYRKQSEFDTDKNIVNMKNGLYDMGTGQLKPHSPDYLSFKQLPYGYDPKAKPKLFDKYLNDVLDPRDKRTLVEAMAYTFHRENRYEIIVILLGTGANGKNVTIHLLTKLHGGNVSNVPLHDLLNNRFALADLEGKNVNIDTELSNVTIADATGLKAITGRQPVRLERKLKDAYETTLYAKLWFNANKLPSSQDDSDGFYRRIIVISYPNQFEGKTDDPYLEDKLTTEEELSGIFNILMEARKSVLKDGVYVNEKSILEKRERYGRASDPIGSFLKEEVAEDSTERDEISKEEFYEAYLKYCRFHRLPTEAKESFGKMLVKLHGFKPNQRSKSKERLTVWKGIRLKQVNDRGGTESMS